MKELQAGAFLLCVYISPAPGWLSLLTTQLLPG